MSETLRDHTLAWLESIGADGLMNNGPTMVELWAVTEIKQCDQLPRGDLVPAFRHADGTYHTEPESCVGCKLGGGPDCGHPDIPCKQYQSWLAHKEAK